MLRAVFLRRDSQHAVVLVTLVDVERLHDVITAATVRLFVALVLKLLVLA